MAECKDCKLTIAINNRGRKRQRCIDCQKQRTKSQIKDNARRYYAKKKEQQIQVSGN